MRCSRGWLLPLLLLLASTASAQSSPSSVATALPSVTLPPELARVLSAYETAWRAKDAAALSSLFAEDGFVLSGGHPPARGRAAIEKLYTGQGGPLFLRAFAFAAEGSSGFILGGYSGQAGTPDEGKFTLTLKRGADGRWLIFSDMDNGNQPPRRPPPTPTPAGS